MRDVTKSIVKYQRSHARTRRLTLRRQVIYLTDRVDTIERTLRTGPLNRSNRDHLESQLLGLGQAISDTLRILRQR